MNTDPENHGDIQQALGSLNNRIIIAIIVGAFAIGGSMTAAGYKFNKLCRDVRMNRKYTSWVHSQLNLPPTPPGFWDEP